MSYVVKHIDDLVVNRDNDRHGPLPTEDAALKWLLENKGDHMRRLAADIASTKKIYEPPLIREEPEGLVIYDGNRRISSLKLLNNPGRATTPEWTKFYSELAAANPEIPDKVECRLEADGEVIDELLYRRHTGSQNGIGQSQWDPTAKHNFIERTGRGRSINIARELHNALKKQGYPRPVWQVPISNVNRLLSGEAQRNRAGLKLKKDELFFTHEPASVLKAITRIYEDMSTGDRVLADVWDAEAKGRYLNELELESILPSLKFALRTPIPLSEWLEGEGDEDEQTDSSSDDGDGGDDAIDTEPANPEPKPKPAKRQNLIPHDVNFGIAKKPELTRVRAIWDELQFRLHLDKQPNAISVLFRVLIEFSATYYLNAVGDTKHSNSSWSEKMRAAITDQRAQGLIDHEYEEILRKFQRNEEVLSASSMNKYIHSADLSPSRQHLCSVWDTLQRFLVNCVKA